MENSKIEWTHHTFNPWWGCTRVSKGCENCYAEATDARFSGELSHWGPKAERKFLSDANWKKPESWNRRALEAGERHRVFCASMADVFEQLPPGHPSIQQMEEARRRLFILIERTPYLDWLILTKRPENHWMAARWQCSAPPNVWLGTTAENQEQADIRIPRLLEAPWGYVKFISYEPALGPVVIPENSFTHDFEERGDGMVVEQTFDGIDWVIAGAESGPGRRPMLEEWIRSMRDQCANADIPFFYKQKIDGMGIKVSLPFLDDRQHSAVPDKVLYGW